MTVYFVDLKYGQVLDCSYALETGMAHEQLDFDKNRYSVGDEVELLLELPKWKWKAIKENCTDKQVEIYGSSFDSLHLVSAKFTIVRKRHVLAHSRRTIGHLQPHSPSLYLKPVSWGHEDIFKWICMGERPSWLTEEEIAEYKSQEAS